MGISKIKIDVFSLSLTSELLDGKFVQGLSIEVIPFFIILIGFFEDEFRVVAGPDFFKLSGATYC